MRKRKESLNDKNHMGMIETMINYQEHGNQV
jgi:hypothetical protein